MSYVGFSESLLQESLAGADACAIPLPPPRQCEGSLADGEPCRTLLRRSNTGRLCGVCAAKVAEQRFHVLSRRREMRQRCDEENSMCPWGCGGLKHPGWCREKRAMMREAGRG